MISSRLVIEAQPILDDQKQKRQFEFDCKILHAVVNIPQNPSPIVPFTIFCLWSQLFYNLIYKIQDKALVKENAGTD